MCLIKSCGDHVRLQKRDLLTLKDWSVSCSSPLCVSLEFYFHELELDGSELIFVSLLDWMANYIDEWP